MGSSKHTTVTVSKKDNKKAEKKVEEELAGSEEQVQVLQKKDKKAKNVVAEEAQAQEQVPQKKEKKAKNVAAEEVQAVEQKKEKKAKNVVAEDEQPVEEKKAKKSDKKAKTEATEEKKAKKSKVAAKEESDVDGEQTVQRTDPEAFAEQYKNTLEEFRKIREAFQTTNVAFKKLETAYNRDIKTVKKQKRKRSGNYAATGFIKERALPNKFCKFLQIKNGSMMTGPKITKAVWAQMRERNLIHPENGRVFRTNAEVNELFGVTNAVNKSNSADDEKGLNFKNLQKYISYALKQ